MLLRRVLKTGILVLAASLAIGPVAALAGGPSAGDNQYTDPLANTTPATTTTAPPAPATPSASPPPSAPASSGTLTSSPSAASGATTPTATTADPSKTLPYTGYDAWLGGALGVGLVAAGFAVRRRLASGS